MDKRIRINKLLRLFKEVMQNYPDFNIDSKRGYDAVYKRIIMSGVDEEEKSFLLDDRNGVFDELINHFRDDDNLDVFVSPNHKYFCQFCYKHFNVSRLSSHIKMYVPLDYDHIEEGAKQLFEFLSEKNILNDSKISKRIRCDDIVVRLVNPEDADSVLDFIKNNSYIQEGLLEPSPFAFEKDNIALACDGHLSYNEMISALMVKYLANRQRDKKLYKVEYDDFYNYIIDQYNKEYSRKEDSDIKSILKDLEIEHYQKDCRDVLYLIIKSQKSNFTYGDFIEHYKRTSNYTNYISANINEQTKVY